MTELTAIEKRIAFVTAFEGSSSPQEVADKLDMTDTLDEKGKPIKGSAAGRVSAKASQLRTAGVSLKTFERGQGFPKIDIDEMDALLAKLRGVTVTEVQEAAAAADTIRADAKVKREAKKAKKAAAELVAAGQTE